jgi:ATP-dependent helicase/DNAse subunit B
MAVCTPRDEKTVAFLETLQAEGESQDGHKPLLQSLDRLRAHVFAASTPPQGELDATLEFRSATDEARECVEIARSILFAAKREVPFDRVAVLLRNPEAYQPLVEDALRRAGIPAFFSARQSPAKSGRTCSAGTPCLRFRRIDGYAF